MQTSLTSITLAVIMAAVTAIEPVRAADSQEIHIDNFTFSPQTLSVPVGTTIVWVNRDDTPHRLVGNKAEFKSPVLDTDEKYSWTATQAGSVAYFCSMHPHMTGTIVVTAK